jgi:hypothetical protein
LLRVPAGHSTLTVETTPGPQPIPDGRNVSVYLSNCWSLVLGRLVPVHLVLSSGGSRE